MESNTLRNLHSTFRVGNRQMTIASCPCLAPICSWRYTVVTTRLRYLMPASHYLCRLTLKAFFRDALLKLLSVEKENWTS
jgi:hypothetical protein